mgnify:FL=1
MFYTISAAAKKLNISAHTLRYYDKEGLLPFIERNEKGIRIFQEKDFEIMNMIECLKKTGMTIKNIKSFIDLCITGDSTIEQRLCFMQQRRQAVLAQIEQMQKTLHMLDYKCWYYETAQAAGTCAVHNHINQEEIKKSFHLDS